MKKLFLTILDFLFPRRLNDAAIFDISPEDFYEKIPKWQGEIYPSMRAIFHYKDPIAKVMIKELKSSKNEHAAEIAGFALLNHLEENNLSDAIIVPMPISKERRRKRGYNQCELIAEFLVRESLDRKKAIVDKTKQDSRFMIKDSRKINDPVSNCNCNFSLDHHVLNLGSYQDDHEIKNSEMCFEIRTDILEKPIDTAKLAFENRAERLKANKGVFRSKCTLSHIERRIIVIDDVITTGSTMSSAMETLRAPGAKKVFGIGIAH